MQATLQHTACCSRSEPNAVRSLFGRLKGKPLLMKGKGSLTEKKGVCCSKGVAALFTLAALQRATAFHTLSAALLAACRGVKGL